MTRQDRFDRYLKIMNWARARYTINGNLVMRVGGEPAPYLRIERAAFAVYLSPFPPRNRAA